MSTLDFVVEPNVECPDDDPNDVAFIRVTATIGGQVAVEEFVACNVTSLKFKHFICTIITLVKL
jgi:hypothetical protein